MPNLDYESPCYFDDMIMYTPTIEQRKSMCWHVNAEPVISDDAVLDAIYDAYSCMDSVPTDEEYDQLYRKLETIDKGCDYFSDIIANVLIEYTKKSKNYW